MTMSPSHGRVDTHESSFGPGATVTLMSSPLHSATTSSKYDAPATYQKRTSQVLHTGVTQASGRFEMTRGVVSEQMSFSSVSAKMNPRNAADMDRQAAALGFHASNGSLLSITEDAVHQAYVQAAVGVDVCAGARLHVRACCVWAWVNHGDDTSPIGRASCCG